jgi:L-ascorbate metabolism protein UlaG (beta-lactamase superfamily)
LHAANYQIPVLESFVNNPMLHARASQSPRLRGGPFLPIPAADAEQVRALLEVTRREFADAIALAAALESFSSRLLDEARGQSLDPFYGEMPEALRGLAELVYDYHNRPSIRFDEGMLYAGSHYKPHLQTLRLTPIETDGARLPFFNTPHLLDPHSIELRIPFADDRVRKIVALDREPQPIGEIAEWVGCPSADPRLIALLDDRPRRRAEHWSNERVRIRYFGHACVLVEAGGRSILVDPFIPVRPRRSEPARFSWDDLPESIDWVLITHAHGDHFALETLIRLRERARCVVLPRNLGLLPGDVSLRALLRKLGFANVLEVDSLESIPIDASGSAGEIIPLPFLGEHGDVAHGSKLTYTVRFGEQKILFFADSRVMDVERYRSIANTIGPIQTIFLNTEIEGAPLSWPYDSLFPKQRDRKIEADRRCRGSNADEALALLDVFRAKRVFNYAMALEPWLEPITGPADSLDSPRLRESDRLLSAARARGLAARRLSGPAELVLDDSP